MFALRKRKSKRLSKKKSKM